MNSAFRLLGSWSVTGIDVRPIEFDENYVVLQDIRSSSIHVYYPNGQLVRKIDSITGDTGGWAYGNGKVLTGGQDKILRIWDAQTGVCLQELEGHNDKINCVELHKDIVLTGSDSGLLTVWDVASTALLASPDGPAKTSARGALSRSFAVNKCGDDGGPFRFGRNFVVRAGGSSNLRVVDFS